MVYGVNMRPGNDPGESEFRAELRGWLAASVPAGSEDGARDEEQQRAWSKSLYAAGYAGLSWPAEYGGRGFPPIYQAIFAEEYARAQAPDCVNVIGLNMVGPAIIRYGTPEQKSRYLPRILSGEAIFCQGFSEPDAGSDLAAIRTSGREVAGGYELNGEKVWSSYAHAADLCLLLARTGAGAPSHQALTCFLLDMRAPGVRVAPIRQISGDTTFSQIVLTGVVTPAASVLGPAGAGWKVAMTTLAHERGTFGVTLTARLAAGFGRLVRTIEAVGADADPAVRRDLAGLYAQLQALRYTGYRALATLERSGVPGPESSVIKLRWSEANQRLCALANRVLSRPGCPQDQAGYWRRELLRSRTNSIEGGTSEILRGVIAERVLGLPRSR